MVNKKIKMSDGSEWYVVSSITFNACEYLLVCDIDNVEQVTVLNYQKENNKFNVETDESILNIVCQMFEEKLKEDL